MASFDWGTLADPLIDLLAQGEGNTASTLRDFCRTNPAAMPHVLDRLVTEENAMIRRGITSAINAFVEEPPVTAAMIERLKTDEEPIVRRNAAAALGSVIKEPAVLDALLAAGSDPEWEVQVAIASSLTNARNLPQAARELQRMMAEGHPQVSQAATTALYGDRGPALAELVSGDEATQPDGVTRSGDDATQAESETGGHVRAGAAATILSAANPHIEKIREQIESLFERGPSGFEAAIYERILEELAYIERFTNDARALPPDADLELPSRLFQARDAIGWAGGALTAKAIEVLPEGVYILGQELIEAAGNLGRLGDLPIM